MPVPFSDSAQPTNVTLQGNRGADLTRVVELNYLDNLDDLDITVILGTGQVLAVTVLDAPAVGFEFTIPAEVTAVLPNNGQYRVHVVESGTVRFLFGGVITLT